VPSKDTAVVVAALSRQIRKLPATLRRSLTWDRGLEIAKHKTFTVATDVKVYFCDPQPGSGSLSTLDYVGQKAQTQEKLRAWLQSMRDDQLREFGPRGCQPLQTDQEFNSASP